MCCHIIHVRISETAFMIKRVWKLFQMWLVRCQMRVVYRTKRRPVYNLQVRLFRTQRHMPFEMPRLLLSAPQTSRMSGLSHGLRRLQFDRMSLLRPGFHVEQERPLLEDRQSTVSIRWENSVIHNIVLFATTGFERHSAWQTMINPRSWDVNDFWFFPLRSPKQASSGLGHSVSRVTGRVKLAATSPTKTVCLVDRRPCSSLLARAWNNVRPVSIRTCDSATMLLANRALILASNVCRAPTAPCVTRLCCCKPANVARRVPQGTYIIIYNIIQFFQVGPGPYRCCRSYKSVCICFR